ncbi:hypothetical protein HC752_12380 [Vibrio sp. S9_S30]|uniref:hypothetical protein n=1 Tax=Vibrio sp. S9_S30 TaxID=2720226 RepID=UPI0016809AF1|nr:hypothetical protein [Vibrio sp. S9_S30]MBD1557730.1 hypothetical protein [Vibrio sp. S9_S30]
MNLYQTLIASCAILGVGCTSTALIEAKNVDMAFTATTNHDPALPSFCQEQDNKFVPESLVTTFLIDQAASFFVDAVDKQVEKELKKKVQVYTGEFLVQCDLKEQRGSRQSAQQTGNTDELAFPMSIQLSSAKTAPKLILPLTLTTSPIFYNASVNSHALAGEIFSSRPYQWHHLVQNKNPKKAFKGAATLNLNWVTYTRNKESIAVNTIFDGEIATLDIPTTIPNRRTSFGKLSGLRPPKDQDRKFPQVHKITLTLTVVERSISAKALKKLAEALENKKDDSKEKLSEKLKERLNVNE